MSRLLKAFQDIEGWFNKKPEELAAVEVYDAEPVLEPVITVGSLWVLKADKGDPFPSKYRNIGVAAHVLDVKGGWVRYSMGPPAWSIFPDNRCPVEDFLRMYEPYNKEVA